MEADFIGNFPKSDPNCAGCGKPLLIENAWMTDGCPCNTPLGVNNANETRWRLLMQLQQRQSFERERLRAALLDLANAADGVGVRFFDTDTMEPEVEAMQQATKAARAVLT